MPRTAQTHPIRPKATWLPPEVKQVLETLIRKSLGGVCLITGILIALALLSYTAADPSTNTISTQEGTQNILGKAGAYTADLLYQYTGIIAWLIPFGLFFWGKNLWKNTYPTHAELRLMALPISITTLMVTLAAIPLTWPTPSGLGGLLGLLAQQNIASLFKEAQIPAGIDMAVLLLLCIIGLVSVIHALNITNEKLLNTFYKIKYHYIINNHRLWVLFNRFMAKITHKPEDIRQRFAQETMHQKKIQELIAVKKRKEQPSKRERAEQEPKLPLHKAPNFQLPPLSLLKDPEKTQGIILNETALAQNARLLEGYLQDFGVKGLITKVRPGPVITLYELEPAPGTKTSKVIGLADDIARSMSALSVRIALIPGKNVIGIELPNLKRKTVVLKELISSNDFNTENRILPLALGQDISGANAFVDLAAMPHMLIAGTTGSGKSVAINTMIASLLYTLTPDQCRMIMIDPKMLELSVYEGIPHLLTPVVTDPSKAIVALKWGVREMEERYRKMSQVGVRNIDGYNKRINDALERGEKIERTVQTGFDSETGKPTYEKQELDLRPMPYIVIVVDEMADLMLVAGKDVEAAIQRLAQMARAAGIHLIMATQRPSVDVITGTIKANFPTRVSFQVTSKIDSRTILGEQGAEQLLGRGDMLYMAAGGRISRVHGPFVSDQEIESVVTFLKRQGSPEYQENITQDEGAQTPGMLESGDGDDDLYQQAVAIMRQEGKISTSFIQRCLRIGYNRAANIVDQMEKEGLVSKPNHVGKREILID